MAKAKKPVGKQTCRDCYNCIRGQRFCSRTCRQIGHPLEIDVTCRWHQYEPYMDGVRRQAVERKNAVDSHFTELFNNM